MDDYISNDTVKEKLIIAGMSELENHGIADFSLRRVAASCNVSCAAPYKHFKSKEDFINEIVTYIHNQWLKLQSQVADVFEADPKRRLVETCVAFIRFLIGNTHFHSVLMMHTESVDNNSVNTKMYISNTIKKMVEEYCDIKGMTVQEKQKKAFKINALVYGAAVMTDSHMIESNEDTIKMLRQCIEQEL